MFRGLRTKIESEQKGQTSNIGPASATSLPGSSEQSGSPSNGYVATLSERKSKIELPKQRDKPCESIGHQPAAANGPVNCQIEIKPRAGEKTKTDVQEALEKEITILNEKLKHAIREREDSNEQNSQLYQLIEKLRRNLELEKKNNTSLTAKLEELEISHKDKSTHLSSLSSFEPPSSKSISIQPTSSLNIDASSCHDVNALKAKIAELQNQISEKNRQLRIKQQNLNDIRKTLQKEIADHNQTKEELKSLREQMK